MASRRTSLIIELMDRVSGPARAVGASLRGVTGSVRRANRAAGGMSERLDAAIARNNAAIGRARMGMIDAVAGYYALRTAIGAPVRAASRFEDAMADVRKVVDFPTPEVFQGFRADLMALSREVPVAVSGLAEIAALAGQSDIGRDEIIAFTEAAAKIGVAFDISAGEAGRSMARLKTALGLTLDETILLADAINHLSNNQASSGAEILDVVRRVGAQATMFGFSAEQTAGFASAMIAAGAESNVAATSFRNMGRALTKGEAATAAQRKAFTALGMDASEVAAAMQRDAVGTTISVLEALSKIPEEQRAAVSSQLFGEEARALGPLLTNLDLVRESLGLVSDEAGYAGSAYAEFDARNATFSANLQRFNNRLEELKITIGNALLPILTDLMDKIGPVVEKMSEFISQHPDLTGKLIMAAAGLIGFRIALSTLKFAGLIGKGGALALMAAGIRGVGTSSTVAADAVAVSTRRIGRSLSLLRLGGLILRFGGPLAALYAGLAPKPTGDGTVSPELRDLMERDPEAMNRASARDMHAVPAGLPPDMTAAMETIQSYRASGDLPTDDMIAGLTDRAGNLRAEIAALEDQIASLADSPKAASIIPPLEGEARALRRKLSGVEDEIGAAERAADDLGAALALIGGMDVAPRINTAALDRAVEQALRLRSLGGAAAAPGATPAIDGERAGGGPVRRGGTYLVGEEGPEVITPSRGGYVHPNDSLGGARVTVAPVFNFTGVGAADAGEIEARVRAALLDEVRKSFAGVFADAGIRLA